MFKLTFQTAHFDPSRPLVLKNFLANPQEFARFYVISYNTTTRSKQVLQAYLVFSFCTYCVAVWKRAMIPGKTHRLTIQIAIQGARGFAYYRWGRYFTLEGVIYRNLLICLQYYLLRLTTDVQNSVPNRLKSNVYF